MNESEFYKATQSRALKGPYLLHGEEELTKAEAVARVKKLLDPGMLALNCQSLQAPDAQTLLQAADQLPFFDELRVVLVENWDDALIDALEKRDRLLNLGDTTVVLFVHRGECRKTNRLFKALAPENRVVAFEKLTMDRAENMLSGMNATATIVLSTVNDVLTIPADALVENGNQTVVYTGYDEENDILLNPVTVKVGCSDGETVEVLEGLANEQTYYYAYYDTLKISFTPDFGGGGFVFS